MTLDLGDLGIGAEDAEKADPLRRKRPLEFSLPEKRMDEVGGPVVLVEVFLFLEDLVLLRLVERLMTVCRLIRDFMPPPPPLASLLAACRFSSSA